MASRHFLSSLDRSVEEMRALARTALAYKRSGAGCIADAPELVGRVLALLFFNPSVRTRVSCEAAMAKLRGTAINLAPGKDTWRFEEAEGVVMDGDTQEHVKELAPVLAGMCDAVGIRKAEVMAGGSQAGGGGLGWEELREDAFLHAFARHSEVPVVNLESNAWHPCQGLADLATLVELLEEPRGQKYVLSWAWHPKALPVATPHSQLMAAVDAGMEVTVLRPEGYDLCPQVMELAAERALGAGGSLVTSDDRSAALSGARVVCAKSWGRLDAYGAPPEVARPSADLRADWIVDGDAMARTDDAWFLHCLPIRRNVIATDEVLDSARCAVARQAANRLWTMAALIADLLGEP